MPLLATLDCAPISQIETFRHRAAVWEVRPGLQPQVLGSGGCSKMGGLGARKWSLRRMGQGVVTEERGLGRGRVVLSCQAGIPSGQTGLQAGPGDERDHRARKRSPSGRPLSAHPQLPPYHSQSLCSQGTACGSRKLRGGLASPAPG